MKKKIKILGTADVQIGFPQSYIEKIKSNKKTIPISIRIPGMKSKSLNITVEDLKGILLNICQVQQNSDCIYCPVYQFVYHGHRNRPNDSYELMKDIAGFTGSKGKCLCMNSGGKMLDELIDYTEGRLYAYTVLKGGKRL
jgi:hypothetical protein